ncbi:MAG TPA: S8 family serine peptidase [Acidobacteriota bacterium]|nr:S8 family serine peptidase [Acidobacteriota bacterium]
MRYRLDEPPFDGNGCGVGIAIVDSGINTDNPHVTAYASGVAIDRDGNEHNDMLDRLGHGTAVAAAIQEKAPGAELHVVRVFETSLSTSAANLARAIDWAAKQGLRLANLSLGTPRREHTELLRDSVLRALEAGLLVVSARSHRAMRWWPGSLPDVIGVVADVECPRDEIIVDDAAPGDGLTLRASPLPRPIPGVPPERNVRGISFAVANATGFLARAMASRAGSDWLAESIRHTEGEIGTTTG